MANTSEKTQEETTQDEAIKYELMLILLPDINDEEIEKELNSLRKHISSKKGEIYHEDNWGIRDLQYTINKNDKGYYAVLYFTFDPKEVEEFETMIRLNQKILRHMMLRVPSGYEVKKLAEFDAEDRVLREFPAKKSKKSPISRPRPAAKIAKKDEKEEKSEKATEPKEEVKKEKDPVVAEVKEEVKEMKKEEKEDKKSLDKLDEQLAGFLDDPDINIL